MLPTYDSMSYIWVLLIIKSCIMKKVLFNDGIYYAKVQVDNLVIFRRGHCKFEFRLCDVGITFDQAREYLGTNCSLTQLDRWIMEA